MKKILFVMAALFGCITSTSAQSTQVATLTHGSDNTMFYGAYALRDALEKAESGDIINLSSGAFQAKDITKAITLRGTGIDSAMPTYILNDFTIDIPSDDANRFTMEGIRCNSSMSLDGSFKEPNFTKCQFKRVNIGYYNDANIDNAIFANCKITESWSVGGKGSAQFVNCYLANGDKDDATTATFLNCVILQENPYHIPTSQFYNSIICAAYEGYDYRFRSTTMLYNCVAIGYPDPYYSLVETPGCSTSTYAEVFKNFTGEYSDDQTFELTDNAKKTFLGTDKTEVGIYGGVLPYTSTPSYPLFTKMDVANKTTTDGKLSVDIEVSAGK